MDLTNNRIVLDSGGLEFSDATTMTTAATGITFAGTTADGMLTYSSGTEIATESTATYASDTLTLSGSGGGIQLDGLNSSSATVLDSYEEGTWVATMTTSGSGTITTNSATLGYIKVGKMVWIHGYFTVTAASSPTSIAKIHTLPFTAETGGTTMYALHPVGLYYSARDSRSVFGWVENNTTFMYLRGDFGTTTLYHGNSAEWFADAGTNNMQVSVNMHYRAST